jgi:beta-mannosidase
LQTVTEPQDWDVFSPVMDARQKSDLGNGLILHYLAATYRYPKDFPSLIYVTQLMQSYAVPYAIEHMRRNRPYSMGTLYWQLNDIWPAISWSSVDYYGRYKALHYIVRHAYAPFTASILDEGTQMAVHVENETREEKTYRLVCAVKDMQNRTLFEKEMTGTVRPFTSACVFEQDFRALVSGKERETYFAYRLYEDDVFLYEDVAFFTKIKHLELPRAAIRTEVSETEDAYRICLASDGFAYRVMLDLKEHDAVFSENYFCLTGEPCTICVRKEDLSAPLTLREFEEELTTFSLRDAY